MDESEDNLSSEDLKSTDGSMTVKTKPKKRSLIERELETSLTARITSPVNNGDGTSTSRYGRARRLKSEMEQGDTKKAISELKSPMSDKSPVVPRTQSPVYKMHASNSPLKRTDSPKNAVVEKFLDNQIETIYQENISLSRFGNEEISTVTPSPAKKFPKVYIRKDLIQKREPEDTVNVIQNMFSPAKSTKKSSSTHLNNILERSSERYSLNSKPQNGYLDNSSVVKTLDFDGKKKKKEHKDSKSTPSKSELFELEAKCAYQVGDLAWARMGTYPFWPSIVTRDPATGVFVKKKLFGRIERDIIHVTFFGDNGRRSWIVDSMLRKYLGQLEFESARENFTPEAKKKDPRLYAAYFISEKKLPLWSASVEEAEMLLREPKRLRIDIFNDMLEKSRSGKAKQPKSKISRTDSDVSLSESLYDSLFSEDDGKSDNNERSRNRTRNKSLDMFEVVTACLDNMAAKTGITKIQKQSHMDRWLQKAKSKTPEKTKTTPQVPTKKLEEKKENKVNGAKKKKSFMTKRPVQKKYSLRKMNDSHSLLSDENEYCYSINVKDENIGTDSDQTSTDNDNCQQLPQELCGIGIIAKVESLANKNTVSAKNEDPTLNDVSANSESLNENSVNMNGTREAETPESETYTDESHDYSNLDISANNNMVDEDKYANESKDSAKDLNAESQCSTELNEPSSDVNSVVLEPPKNQDSELKTPNETLNSEFDNVIRDEKSADGTRSSDHDSEVKCHSKSQNSNEVNETTPMDIDSEVNNTTESKDSTESSLRNREVSTDIVDTNTEDIQGIEIDESTIETENFSQVTSNTIQEDKESFTQVTQTDNLNKDVPSIGEYEADNVFTDDDSDSERLPYSPLSNLGNNSDDNLSLDDVPFINDNETELVNQKLDTVNKKDIKDSVTDNNTRVTYNLNDNNVEEEEIRKHELNKTDGSKDEAMDIDNSLTAKIVENGHISDDNNMQIESENSDEAKNVSKHEDYDNDLGIKNISNVNTQDSLESVNNGYRGKNVREIKMATKEVSIYISDCSYKINEPVKENGYHSMNGDCDLETASLHSEDSVASTKSENRRKLRSKLDKKQEDPLENPEFVKYVELRQDAIMDENPELNEKEIIAYLYKTWLYEENAKSDVKKNDDLRELNSVKGLNLPQMEATTRNKRNLSLNKRETTKTNTIQRFLRKNRDVERTSDIDNDEICIYRKRGVRKNMIIDDDSDDTSINENVAPSIKKNGEDISFEVENNETSNDQQNLPNADVIETPVETAKSKVIEDNKGAEIKKEIKVEEDSGIVKDSPVPSSSFTNSSEQSTETDNKIDKQDSLPTETSDLVKETPTLDKDKIKSKDDFDKDSIDSEDSEAPLIRCKLRSKAKKENEMKEDSSELKIKNEDVDTISINSEDSEISITRRKKKIGNKKYENAMDDPEFVKYLELRQDALIDENPELTQEEIVTYLYQTWLYEETTKSEINKTDEIEQSTLVKGLKDTVQQPKKIRRKVPKTEKTEKDSEDISTKDKPKRKSVKPFYNEEYSDIEEELEVFEIFKPKNKEVIKAEPNQPVTETEQTQQQVEVYDEIELYFAELTKPKPNIFKGLIREKVCEICEKIGCLVKCKGCSGMFHVDCVKKQVEPVEVPILLKGRKKKKRQGRRPKNSDEFDTDDKSQDVSEENNASIEEILEADSHAVDAEVLEAQLSAKMKEILDNSEKIDYESYSSDEGLDWNDTVPGKCEIIDVKLKPRSSSSEIDYSDFKCNNCQQYDTPVCFVCKEAVSKKDSTKRQKCHVAHCHKYYHLDCLDHWPQTQFNGGEPSKNNKKINEHFEAMSCPRHVCHTCVSDDPRGCKTRFSGDKLARCVRCPATYHSFTKCLPAGTQILTASHIICPRHCEHRPGKVPCHVNTGWCFICALGGSLICCEYCPTSFHAECLNIDPPEGGYMCEDCETGRLPLYGEMVWVKLGHYRWWPGIILHPYEIPENLMAVKHSPGEFVVRFFGQYDHYWVNRGRVFPFQEGDSGRISSQKSKIDAAFTTAMEHAQRACEILKTAQPNEEESLDIASSLLPPHYVKLKVNRPCGSLCGRRLEDPESSLTQCECNPADDDPCGPYSQCLNRMLLTECGPTCRAGDRCNNRAFEKRLYPKLVPYRTPSRGWGLKTLEDIKAGQFVIEYVGELIDEEEFRRRMRRKHEMRDENFYFLTLDKERMIDAGPKGNLARFMNHCCEPNCETQKWTVLGDVRVGLFALFDIPAHSEVTFNYNLECAGIDKKRCMCGAKRCSGYIGAKPKQDESQTKKNKMQPGKRTYKKRKPEESPSTKNKRPIGRPRKPRELTEIEKDLLIIRNATNGLSSDESSRTLSSEYERNPKALKRKRVSFSTEEVIVYDGTESPSVKKSKIDDKLEGN